jgi:hypothetical protein
VRERCRLVGLAQPELYHRLPDLFRDVVPGVFAVDTKVEPVTAVPDFVRTGDNSIVQDKI